MTLPTVSALNHRIKCRDKLRSPGAREKKHLLREHEEEGETAFSVVGDIAKAHRRYKHAAKEHGYLACQVDAKEEVPGDPASQTVYVNQVGTFGLSCASYCMVDSHSGLRAQANVPPAGPGLPARSSPLRRRPRSYGKRP